MLCNEPIHSVCLALWLFIRLLLAALIYGTVDGAVSYFCGHLLMVSSTC